VCRSRISRKTGNPGRAVTSYPFDSQSTQEVRRTAAAPEGWIRRSTAPTVRPRCCSSGAGAGLVCRRE
jgi:hypothetical protein